MILKGKSWKDLLLPAASSSPAITSALNILLYLVMCLDFPLNAPIFCDLDPIS